MDVWVPIRERETERERERDRERTDIEKEKRRNECAMCESSCSGKTARGKKPDV